MDEGLEASLPVGTTFATRYAPDRFVMTAGVGMPVDAGLLMTVVESTPQLLRKSHTDAIEDRRFAEAVYRAAIAEGITEGISYEETRLAARALTGDVAKTACVGANIIFQGGAPRSIRWALLVRRAPMMPQPTTRSNR
jgi:hypothetical protein